MKSGDARSAVIRAGRTERAIAVMRAVVIGATALVYVASIGVRRSASVYAVGVLAVASLYALWVLLGRPSDRAREAPFRAGTLAVDAGLVTLWCDSTGAGESEFWALYLLVVISAAVRYGLAEVLGVALAQSGLYLGVMAVSGGMALSSVIFRPTMILLAGLSVGMVAQSRRHAEARRAVLELTARDVSEQLELERRESDRLRELDEVKTEFVAIAAHELRGPLGAIRGVIETLRRLRDDIEPEVEDELLEGAAEQAARLTRLLDDLLTVSRIEAGSASLQLVDVPVEDILADAMQASGTESLASATIVGIETVRCDPDRLVRVLANLLDNARKHSPDGAVIGLDVRQENGAVRFAVRDRGAGVPETDREAVFERYRRIDESRVKGTGLGLFIARSIVEAHGGRIAVGDAQDGGAEFYFLIPAPTPSGGRASRPSEPASV